MLKIFVVGYLIHGNAKLLQSIETTAGKEPPSQLLLVVSELHPVHDYSTSVKSKT